MTGLDLLFIQNIGPTELMLILLVALLLFGGRLPQVARNLGKSFVEFKKGLRDLNDNLRSEMDNVTRPAPPPTPPPPPRQIDHPPRPTPAEGTVPAGSAETKHDGVVDATASQPPNS